MPSLFERASDLASSGMFQKVTETKLALKREGYERVDQHFDGRGFYTELRNLLRAARGGR